MLARSPAFRADLEDPAREAGLRSIWTSDFLIAPECHLKDLLKLPEVSVRPGRPHQGDLRVYGRSSGRLVSSDIWMEKRCAEYMGR